MHQFIGSRNEHDYLLPFALLNDTTTIQNNPEQRFVAFAKANSPGSGKRIL
jgi:hypothetical protein